MIFQIALTLLFTDIHSEYVFTYFLVTKYPLRGIDERGLKRWDRPINFCWF